MDSLTSVEITPPVSSGEGTSVPAASSGSVETQPTAPTQPVGAQESAVSGGENVAAAPEDEFPDDAAFQQLPGEQRSSNWQRARARIAELNTQSRQLTEKAALAAQIEQLGDFETVKKDAELARSLLSSYRKDEYGNVIYDPQTRLPQMTATPFIQQLQQEAPDAFYTMAWEALDQPIDQNQTVGDWLLKQRYGLDPKLLDAYRQIQSPQDAMRFNPQMVNPEELTYVPNELHEAYKSFDAEDRQYLQDLSLSDEDRFLSRLRERAEHLNNQKFIAETKAEREQVKQQQQQQWEARIQQSTEALVNQKREQTYTAQLERLKTQYSPFGPEDGDGNQMVYDDVLTAADRIFENPAILEKAKSAGNFYYQYQYYTANQNPALASRALAQADALAMDIQREYAKAATQRVELWNQRLKGRINAAQPRETTPAQQTRQLPPQSVTNQPRPTSNGFGLSEERKREIATAMALQRQGAV